MQPIQWYQAEHGTGKAYIGMEDIGGKNGIK